jgi:hypothetical protein
MEKWDMIKRVIRLCHNCNGTIFGGAARDSYIHDYNARKFYQKYDGDRYNDTELTEFAGRFVVPNDVDCLILAEDHEKLLTEIHHKFHVKVNLNVDANYLAGMDLSPGEYRFKRYSIVDLKDVPVVLQLDMIIQVNGDKLLNPFKHVDMDVNALWWTKDSMIVNPKKVHFIGRLYHDMGTPVFGLTYTTLFENILSKKATICTSKCSSRRILKMKKQGWEVTYPYEEAIYISNAPYDGVCVLCQDTIEGDHSTFSCKCAHICMGCLRKHYAAIPRCTICKMPVNEDALRNEVRIYNAIQFDQDFPDCT